MNADERGGAMLVCWLFGLYPFPLQLYPDGGHQGPAFLVEDWECLSRKAHVYLLPASIRLMVRRLGRNEG
jgi:hypothetical protein